MADHQSVFENYLKKGLTGAEASERLKKFGLNKLPETKRRSPLTIFISQFKNPLIYVISAAAIISLILAICQLAEYTDAVIIIVVILVDCVMGFFQENKAESTIIFLRELLRPVARVIRDENVIEIDVAEIVVDDIVMLNPGDKTPADGKILEAISLAANEAILTGESESIMKKAGDMAYMGTTILSGRGIMKVTSTGLLTELGKIAESLREIKTEATPLQIRLDKFSKTLTYLVIAICIAIFTTGLLLKFNILESIELSIVLAIAAIPEGLIIAVTMILVIGMRAILRRKGLVKRLLAVEILGTVTTICTDKTGTLTQGIMQIVKTDFRSEKNAAYIMTLCNDLADSLEVSLWSHVKVMSLDPQEIFDKYPRVYEIPFSSEKKYMLTTNKIEGEEVSLLKGAPDIVMEYCNLNSEEKAAIEKELEEWGGQGLKVLALAFKDAGNIREVKDFTWIGIVGIEDPIRPTVKDAIALCRRAGIRVKMITGDYRKTAEKVAQNLGLMIGSHQIIEGKDLDQITEEELAKIVKSIVIFCRVTPQHKLKIVNTLQMNDEVTAMIGDGVNDAPALKKSNIGVSVGNATDVAKETASLILLDNNFGTLVNSVEEGRIIFDNIKKVVAYVLSNSFAEIFVLFASFILHWDIPLTVAQILWIHLVCDGPADIALGFERGEKGIMDEPPKYFMESILDQKSKFLILIISVVSALLCLILFNFFAVIGGNLALGRTIVFSILGLQSMIYIFSYRSLHYSLLKSGNIFANKPLVLSVILGIGLIVMGVYIPGLNSALGTVSLDLWGWGIVLAEAFGMVAIVEFVKFVYNKVYSTPMKGVFKNLQHAQRKIPEINHLHNISVDILRDRTIIQFHFDLPAETPLEAAHKIANSIEQRIQEEFPVQSRRNLEIISHIEPGSFPYAKLHSHAARPASLEIQSHIENTLNNTPQIKRWDNLTILEEGKSIVISMVAYFEGNLSILQVHQTTEEIEAEFRKKIPNIKRCIIHSEPCKNNH